MTNEDKFINSLRKKNKINSNDFFEMVILSNNNILKSKIENAINSSNSLRVAYTDFLNKEFENIKNLNSSKKKFNYSNKYSNNRLNKNFKFKKNSKSNNSYQESILEKQISNLSKSAKNNRKKKPKRKTINKSTNNSTTSKKIKVHTGPRGGKYIVVNGRHQYV